MTEWWRKLIGLLRREDMDADLREEMQTHLEMKAAATGDPHTASRQFENTTLHLEDSRAPWGWPRFEAEAPISIQSEGRAVAPAGVDRCRPYAQAAGCAG